MNLVFAIKTIKTVKGGAERVFSDVASEMARRGHNVTVLSFDTKEGENIYELDSRVSQEYLGAGDPKRKTRLFDLLYRLPKLRKEIRRIKPDVAIGFMHAMYVPLSVSLIGTGIPVVASEHITPEYYKHRRFEYILLTLCGLFIEKFLVLSDGIGQRYPRILRSKMSSIPNAVHPARKTANPRGKNKKRKVILNVGRLVDFKDQKTLIDAFARLAKEYSDWILRIVGEGELRSCLENKIKKYGLEDRIEMPGLTENIEREYISAHIFVISSIYEGFGLATAEAAAHGLPAIGFIDCTGTNEIINDGVSGILVDPGDRVENLAQGLKILMEDPLLREKYGKNGINIMKRYAPNKVFNRWQEVMSTIS